MNPYMTLGLMRNATPDQIKRAYHKLAHGCHPDLCPGDPKAAENFRLITEAYELLIDPDRRAAYDKHGMPAAAPTAIVLKSKKHQYTIAHLACSGDLSTLYKATNEAGEPVMIKVARNPANNDLLENELTALKKIRDTSSKHIRYFPEPLDSFKVDDGARKQAIVFTPLTNFYSLATVRNSLPAMLDPSDMSDSAGVQIEHGVWMFNRMLEGLDYAHSKGIVHGAVTPDHVMVYSTTKDDDPYNHGAKLVDWAYSAAMNTPIQAVCPKYEEFYPPEVLAKSPATAGTDIYMAAKCAIYVLGGNTALNTLPTRVPRYLSSFLRGCVINNPKMRANSAWDLHEELKDHMAKHYGPKKYVRFAVQMRA